MNVELLLLKLGKVILALTTSWVIVTGGDSDSAYKLEVIVTVAMYKLEVIVTVEAGGDSDSAG